MREWWCHNLLRKIALMMPEIFCPAYKQKRLTLLQVLINVNLTKGVLKDWNMLILRKRHIAKEETSEFWMKMIEIRIVDITTSRHEGWGS